MLPNRLKQMLSSHLIKTSPLTALAQGGQLAWDVLTRRDMRQLKVNLTGAEYLFETYPKDARSGSRGISLYREYYEPLLFHAHLYIQPGHTVIDGGANSGIFSCAFGALGASVHAFEPLTGPREHLKTNLTLNKLTHRVHVIDAALSDHTGDATMNTGNGAVSASLVHDNGGHPIAVKVENLDHYAERAELAHVDFIKLDIEGAELSALHGAKSLIERDRPLICLEVWNEQELNDIRQFLAPFSYQLFILDYEGEKPLPSPFRPIANLLARPA